VIFSFLDIAKISVQIQLGLLRIMPDK
jgi:hypothetical protein